MALRPLVLIHGYSASGSSFDRWKEIFLEQGYDESDLHICTYKSLTNEVTIKDIAEGLDRALRIQTGLDGDEEFDAVVHSTGMLVVRAWLVSSPERRSRLKHLVGLAPATFGSPLAHKGRGWLGAIFRGNRERGPDFMEAGDLILDGLELASKFTWDLAHQDLLDDETIYGPDADTPYAFIFCGTAKYPFPLNIISEDGTDGTVRLAGAALNTRKIVIDLTLDGDDQAEARRVQTAPWSAQIDMPMIAVADRDHGTIMSNPPSQLVQMVMQALAVSDADSYHDWYKQAQERSMQAIERSSGLKKWQQFIVRVVDERGDGVNDYYLDFIVKPSGMRKWRRLRDHVMHVRPYSGDPSYRCFHINLDSLKIAKGDALGVRIVASSGTALVGYEGYSDDDVDLVKEEAVMEGEWSGVIDLESLQNVEFFYPFTTTLVQICLNREPQPLLGRNDVFWFLNTPKARQAVAADALRGAHMTAEQQERLEELYQELVAQQQ